MKIDGKTFTLMLTHAKRIADPKSPVLGYVRLSAENGTFAVEATDLTSWIALRAPCPAGEILPPILINPQKLAPAIESAKPKKGRAPEVAIAVAWKPGPSPSCCDTSHLKEKDVVCQRGYAHDGDHEGSALRTFETVRWSAPAKVHRKPPDEPTLTIGVGARRFTLAAQCPDDWPKMPLPTAEHEGHTYPNTAALHEAIAFAEPAICKDETRGHLCAVWLEADQVHANDGHRLHLTRGLPRLSAPAGSIWLPAKATRALLDTLGAHAFLQTGTIGQGRDQRVAIFTSTLPGKENPAVAVELRVTWKTLSPAPIESVIPTACAFVIEADRDALAEAVAFAGKIGSAKCVTLAANGALAIRAGDPVDEDGAVTEEVPAKVQGTGEVSFCAAYLTDALRGLGSRVVLTGSGLLDPIKIETNGDESRLAVIMPIRP